jgi:hypothetical protein
MQAYLSDLDVEKQYVALDECVVPTDATSLEFDGWRSHHRLDCVPQVAALQDASVVETLLSNVDYWESRAHDE